MITIYGIPNCDSCRAARKWLKAEEVDYEFHDIRVDGLDITAIHRWAGIVGWQQLLNTRSQTWRRVPQSERDSIDEGRALTLMFEQPTLIKRPIYEDENTVMAGFDEGKYAAAVSR